MNKNKLYTALMAGTMIMGSVLPVCAATSKASVINYDPILKENDDATTTTKDTEVSYEKASTFTVTIPKTIVLDGNTKDADYTVNVKGDISSDKQVSVAPQDALEDVDGINFYMVDQATAGIKKANVPATVTQDETVWSSAEVCVAETGTTKDGNVAAPTITAGSWKGTFTFNIALQNAQ